MNYMGFGINSKYQISPWVTHAALQNYEVLKNDCMPSFYPREDVIKSLIISAGKNLGDSIQFFN